MVGIKYAYSIKPAKSRSTQVEIMQKISDKKLVAKFSGITPVEQKCQKSA